MRADEDERADEREVDERADEFVDESVDERVQDIAPELVEGVDEDDARARMSNQASREDRRAVADVVIDNSGPLGDLDAQVDDAWAWMKSLPHPAPEAEAARHNAGKSAD